MEWISEHAPELLNRGQVGADGRTPYYRLYGKHSNKGLLEFGEQVMAKPLRQKKTTKKLALKDRWVHATWVGVDHKTNEHVVVLRDGGAAIRVRTVLRRPKSDRWDAKALGDVKARPKMPNPKDEEQAEALPERLTKRVELGVQGEDIDMPRDKPKDIQIRDFKISKKLLEKHGHTHGCKGCEAARRGGIRNHDLQCRRRLEELMKNDEASKHLLEERDARIFRKPVDEQMREDGDHEVQAEEVNVENLLRDSRNVVDVQMQGSRGYKRESDEAEESNEEADGNQDAKKRKLRLLQSEKQLLRLGGDNRRSKPNRFQLNRVLNDLEWGVQVTRDRYIDVSDLIGAIGPTPHDEEKETRAWDRMYDDVEFLDDMNGFNYLDKAMVVAARRLEVEFFKKRGVYVKVDRDDAKKLGGKVLTTRWLDTNKGDSDAPNYRSRLIEGEIKKDNRIDLFSATPPLETLKLLLSMCSKNQEGKNPWRVAIVDIKRAYFYALVRRSVFIEIPGEDFEKGDESKVAQLKMSLYGTRDAAQNWTREHTRFLQSIGFKKGRASPCNFHHASKNIRLTVHGDDFLIVAPDDSLEWMRQEMSKKFEIKYNKIGPSEKDDK